MECAMTYQTVRSTRLLSDTFEEKAFDGDFVLPDYLPEIAAILSCELQPVIENRQISGNRLTVDGTACVRVLYVDSSRCKIHCYETCQPFSAGFAADVLCEPALADVYTSVSYVNYRAIGPRRLDVRGAYRIHAKILDTVTMELPCDTTDSHIQLRQYTHNESLPAESGEKIFAVNEVLDPGSNGNVASVVRAWAAASIAECKVLSGRVIVKGDIALHTLYEPETENESPLYEECEHNLLYSQMLDVKGLEESDSVITDVRVLSCDVHSETEEGTGKCVLIANLRLALSLQSWRQERSTFITDAYSTEAPVQPETTERSCYRLLGSFDRRLPVRQQVELPEGVVDIVDLWCSCSPISRDGNVSNQRLQIHLLAKDENGSIVCYERSAEFPLELPIMGNSPRFDVRVWECSYRVKEERQLELNITVLVVGTDIHQDMQTVITSLESEPAKAYAAPEATLKIVFAGKDESVWEIAKTCHVSADRIREENRWSADNLSEDTLLVIPMI